jgi:hypothetical protein
MVCVLLNCFTWLAVMVAMNVKGSPEMSRYKVLPCKL